MKSLLFFLLTLSVVAESDTTREANTIVLDETGVKNLKIQTVEVQEGTFERTVFALGRLEAIPEKRSVLSSRIPGRIIESEISLGQYVTKGEKLVLLESRQPGDPPPSVWLTAPANGTILSVNAVLGSPVEPDDILCEIADLSTMYAIATVPQTIAGAIQQGTIAQLHLPLKPDKKLTGTLLKFTACPCPDPSCALGQNTSKRSSEDDKNSASSGVIFTIANPDNQLRPGINAEFSIIMEKRQNVLSVPRSAVQGDAASRYVYVKDFEIPHAFVKAPVEVGEISQEKVEIVKGLLPADEVVTNGAYSLSFAGGGSVSLKDALDAAHGHEHAADGGELTPEKIAEMAAAKGGDKAVVTGGGNPLWMYVSAVLLVLLIVSVLTKKYTVSSEENAATYSSNNPGPA